MINDITAACIRFAADPVAAREAHIEGGEVLKDTGRRNPIPDSDEVDIKPSKTGGWGGGVALSHRHAASLLFSFEAAWLKRLALRASAAILQHELRTNTTARESDVPPLLPPTFQLKTMGSIWKRQ